MIFHNTKLINLGETEVSFFYLYCWLLFFLSERCRQPLATRRERLHLSERDTLLLHFVLELAVSHFRFGLNLNVEKVTFADFRVVLFKEQPNL